MSQVPLAKLESENGTLKVHQITWLNVSFAQFLAHMIINYYLFHGVISIFSNCQTQLTAIYTVIFQF